MNFPVMIVTNEGKNLMSEAVQSGAKIEFDKVIVSFRKTPTGASIEDIEALTYTWYMAENLKYSGDVTKVTLQTDAAGKSFINVSGEIFSDGIAKSFYANTVAITARIGDGPLKLFGISKGAGTPSVVSFGTSGTTKIHVSANISTASVGTDIIAYTFDSNYVTGDDFDMLSQTLRSDIEVAKRSDLANRHYYNNPLDAIRYSDPMNSFKLRSGLYPELNVDMKGDSTRGNSPLSFIRLEHERCSLILGYRETLWTYENPQICVSGKFIKVDGTVVEIQDVLNDLSFIATSTLYQDAFPEDVGVYATMVDILVSYDDTTLDIEIILEFDIADGSNTKLVASINPRTGIMNWIKSGPSFGKSVTSIGYLDLAVTILPDFTWYSYRLYKNASNKQGASRFAYTWADRELAPGILFSDCAVLDIVLFNNEPYLIMESGDGMFAVPHDVIDSQSVEGSTIALTYDSSLSRISPRSNYLLLGNLDDYYELLSPFKSIPNRDTYSGTYVTKSKTVITDYGYKELDSTSEFVPTPSETTPDTDYTVHSKQRVDTDIKYVVCNGRLIPHID